MPTSCALRPGPLAKLPHLSQARRRLLAPPLPLRSFSPDGAGTRWDVGAMLGGLIAWAPPPPTQGVMPSHDFGSAAADSCKWDQRSSKSASLRPYFASSSSIQTTRSIFYESDFRNSRNAECEEAHEWSSKVRIVGELLGGMSFFQTSDLRPHFASCFKKLK